MNVGRPGALPPDARASGSPRRSLAEAAERYLPGWAGRLTPHVLRHYCASQLYRGGMSLLAIQELLGHSWTGTTANGAAARAGWQRAGRCRGRSPPGHSPLARGQVTAA